MVPGVQERARSSRVLGARCARSIISIIDRQAQLPKRKLRILTKLQLFVFHPKSTTSQTTSPSHLLLPSKPLRSSLLLLLSSSTSKVWLISQSPCLSLHSFFFLLVWAQPIPACAASRPARSGVKVAFAFREARALTPPPKRPQTHKGHLLDPPKTLRSHQSAV